MMRAAGLVAVVLAVAASAKQCNIEDYGARGDGTTNCTEAISKAIEDCASGPNNSVVVPAHGDYLSWPLAVPASAGLTFEVNGNLSAPSDPAAWPSPLPEAFIKFHGSQGLALSGTGTINGNGDAWWSIRRKDPSHDAPALVLVENAVGAVVSTLRLMHSPKFHLILNNVSASRVVGIHVNAPYDSPNTDAIDPGDGAHDILIQDIVVSNGDDCVAIKSGTYDITIVNASCTYGHGISIGSIGENDSRGVVSNITVRDSRFSKSENGCRVKTWQGGTGAVSGIVFDGVSMEDVLNPIVINQFYCPSSQHPKPCSNSSRAVAVSNVTFRGISGTTPNPIAAEIVCSDAEPCRGIVLDDIDLAPASGKGSVAFRCWEAYGTATNVKPSACLWGPRPPTWSA